MAITYTWKMKEIKIVDQTNSEGKVLKDAVVQTLWQKIGKDDEGNEGIFMGATPLTAVNVPEADFKELSTLTEEQVLGWIKAIVEPDAPYVAHINEVIEEAIEKDKIKIAPLPWDPEAPAGPAA